MAAHGQLASVTVVRTSGRRVPVDSGSLEVVYGRVLVRRVGQSEREVIAARRESRIQDEVAAIRRHDEC